MLSLVWAYIFKYCQRNGKIELLTNHCRKFTVANSPNLNFPTREIIVKSYNLQFIYRCFVVNLRFRLWVTYSYKTGWDI